MSHRILIGNIATILRADTGVGSLVALTKHNTTKKILRIARDSPDVKGMVPFLGIFLQQSVAVQPDVTRLQVARIHFRCYSSDEMVSVDIADRMESLLKQDDTDTERTYLNFTGNGVKNLSTLLRPRTGARFDDDTDIWLSSVQADVYWIDATCP